MAKEETDDQILVVATASGFYGGIAREPGDQFRVPKKKLKSSWFKAVAQTAKGTKAKDKAEEPKSDEPETKVEDGTAPSEDLV